MMSAWCLVIWRQDRPICVLFQCLERQHGLAQTCGYPCAINTILYKWNQAFITSSNTYTPLASHKTLDIISFLQGTHSKLGQLWSTAWLHRFRVGHILWRLNMQGEDQSRWSRVRNKTQKTLWDRGPCARTRGRGRGRPNMVNLQRNHANTSILSAVMSAY